ncbi:unnamed protein product [Phytomonas sp. EM1]|nr:unnamed protein product [Phytomonas sp. EM1]|eukprot:CCW63568.1 unnamed protein product [Phytomonas sp. isolate EM1]
MVVKISKSGGSGPSAKKRSATTSSSIEGVVETTSTSRPSGDSQKEKQPPSSARKPLKRVKFDDEGLVKADASLASKKIQRTPTPAPAKNSKEGGQSKRPRKVEPTGEGKRRRARAEDDQPHLANHPNANENEADDDNEEEEEVRSLVDSSGSEDDLNAKGEEDEEDLSELASLAGSDGGENDKEENPFQRARRTGERLAYAVLQLRFLPPEFQEPQLFKFLGQFGASVLNCFCVRSRRTHQSKGIAYVQFDRESVLPTVVEECHGMLLGGRTVRAKTVILHRAMPSRESVAKRRQLAYAYKTKGAPLKRHNVSRKDPVALLIKAARTEAQNNAYLKSLGIDYTTDFFTSQLANIPADQIDHAKKPRGMKLGKPTVAAAEENAEIEVTAGKASSLEAKKTTRSDPPLASPPKVEEAAKTNDAPANDKRQRRESVAEKKGTVEKSKATKKMSKPTKPTKPLKKSK